jgi:uncharacterized protein
MIRITLILAALAGSAAIPVLPAQGASFDCATAQKPDETAICESTELSALDSEMGGLWYAYSKVPMLMGGSGARHDEAEAFLQRRASCGSDERCLASAYRERILSLKSGLDKAISQYSQVMNAPSEPDDGVAAIVAGYAEQCSTLGGVLASGADQPWTMTADLDGDGLPDYVLNTQGLECSGSATAFCGNGGCQVDIALSSVGLADPTSVLGGQPTLIQAEAGTTLQLWVDGTHCGLEGSSNEECWATFAWTNGKLETSYSKRPAAE